MYEWRPFKWTGGTTKKNVVSPAIWSCDSDYRINVSASRLWVSRSTTMQYTGSVKIGAASLKSTQKHTDDVKIYYDRDDPEGSGKLCGRGGYPVDVNQVREVS